MVQYFNKSLLYKSQGEQSRRISSGTYNFLRSNNSINQDTTNQIYIVLFNVNIASMQLLYSGPWHTKLCQSF